ncbi:MAG: PqqD family peptide modification chaperone [Victivallaceae bacterium]
MILNNQIIFRKEFDNSGVLFDPDSGNVVGVNPVGGIIWESLEQNLEKDKIFVRLHEQVANLPPEVDLYRDVEDFLNDLQRRGFLSR